MRSSPAASRSTPIFGNTNHSISRNRFRSRSRTRRRSTSSSVCFGRALDLGWAPHSGFRMARRRTRAPSTKSRTLSPPERAQGLPELHVWINQTIPSFQPEPPEVHDERIAQWRALKRFIEQWTKDSEDGSFVGSFTAYHTIAEFQDLFEVKLRKIAERRVAVSPGTLAPPAKPVWTEGSPFRGLEPFDFKHAPIFFRAHRGDQRRDRNPPQDAVRQRRSPQFPPGAWSLGLRKILAGPSRYSPGPHRARRDRGRRALAPSGNETLRRGWRRVARSRERPARRIGVCRSWRVTEPRPIRLPPIARRHSGGGQKRTASGIRARTSDASNRRSRLSFDSAKRKTAPRTRRPCASVCKICARRPRGWFCSSTSSKSCLRVEFPRKNGTRF